MGAQLSLQLPQPTPTDVIAAARAVPEICSDNISASGGIAPFTARRRAANDEMVRLFRSAGGTFSTDRRCAMGRTITATLGGAVGLDVWRPEFQHLSYSGAVRDWAVNVEQMEAGK